VAIGLATRQLLPNLTKLVLAQVEFSSQLLTSLCVGTAPVKLQELYLVRGCVTDSQLLPTLGRLQHLRVLRLVNCSSLQGEHDISPLAQLRELWELHLVVDDLVPIGLSSVLSACTQLRELTVPYAHHITPELRSTSLTKLSLLDIIMSMPFLLDVGWLPSLRALSVGNLTLCEDAEQGMLPQSAGIVEHNARMLASLPAAVEVVFGGGGKSILRLIGMFDLPVQESGGVVEALLSRLGPLATLPAAQGLHVLQLDYMIILPGSIAALVLLFPGLRFLHLTSGEDDNCILSPQALFEACTRFPCLDCLNFDLRIEMIQMFSAACAYVQLKREGQGGSVLELCACLPQLAHDKGERAAFEGLQSDFNALFPAGTRKVELVAF